MAVDEFLEYDHKDHKHPILWEESNVPDGFPNIDNNELGTDAAWQFCLYESSKAHPDWRVHGFAVDEIFYVVWLDPNHELTSKPTKRKAPLKS
jgi:hypothetical protein